jgi:TPR repeat protein
MKIKFVIALIILTVSSNVIAEKNISKPLYLSAGTIESSFLKFPDKSTNLPYKDLSHFEKEILLATQGDSEEQYNLGLIYLVGRGALADHSQAAKWFRRAAEQGIPDAQYNLGVMYQNGDGVAKDSSVAAMWYKKADQEVLSKEQNDMLHQGVSYPKIHAEINLGVMYATGVYFQTDYEMAATLFQKAADLGFPIAQYNLGVMYLEGNYFPKNYAVAAQWFRKAGFTKAKEALDYMSTKGEIKGEIKKSK